MCVKFAGLVLKKTQNPTQTQKYASWVEIFFARELFCYKIGSLSKKRQNGVRRGRFKFSHKTNWPMANVYTRLVKKENSRNKERKIFFIN